MHVLANYKQTANKQTHHVYFHHELQSKFSAENYVLEIAYNDNLHQCLRYRRGKVHWKNFWTQICAKGVKIGLEKNCFFAIFSSVND